MRETLRGSNLWLAAQNGLLLFTPPNLTSRKYPKFSDKHPSLLIVLPLNGS